MQTALSTSRASATDAPAVRLVPFTFGPEPPAVVPSAAAGGPTDLERIVDACASAWAGHPPPRRPWPDPLPERLDRSTLASGDVALADDPDGQRQDAIRWEPATGNLVVYGIGGSGTTTTLTAVAVSLAEREPPDRLHLYAIDHGAGSLAALAALPHCGAVLGAAERERQQRLVRSLRAELDRRRGARAGASEPRLVLLLDNVAAFLAAFDDAAGLEVLDAFARVFADGPGVGVHVAVTADRAGALPTTLAALARHAWWHRVPDGPGGPLPPGRFVDAASRLVAQVGVPQDGWGRAIDDVTLAWRGVGAAVPGVGELPDRVGRASLAIAPMISARPWRLPVAVADDDLGAASLPVHAGDHLLVAGPGRSGRTTALATIGTAARAGGARVAVLAGTRPSWLTEVFEPVAAAELGAVAGPALVLVDDADTVDELDLRELRDGVHVVAAGRTDVLRGAYGHWTRAVRRSRVGLLLRPHLDLDGDLLGAALPRRVSVPMTPGRGFLVVDGAARLVQVALPGCGA
jgi:S-DNA-T family DNA segregation ATPase FtsK/SpoIIIE